MSEKQETVADIVAEMRGPVKPGETLNNTYELLNGFADRYDAAHKREVESVAARCCSLGRLAGYGASEIKHQRESGNRAKMREALESVDDAFSSGSLYAPGDCPTPHDVSVFEDVRDKVKTALATPPRNCDVGTAEEQIGRHNEYCRHLKDTAARYNFNLDICDDCRYCFAKWAQMPYEEGGKK